MRDDFTKFSTISQWFQTLIHPALMQRRKLFFSISKCSGAQALRP
ncbi:O-methyltransferase family protein [C1] [Richelia intracellularis]|nr:O-methyltransferase family protein [C1] [Richelia intracellularis]